MIKSLKNIMKLSLVYGIICIVLSLLTGFSTVKQLIWVIVNGETQLIWTDMRSFGLLFISLLIISGIIYTRSSRRIRQEKDNWQKSILFASIYTIIISIIGALFQYHGYNGRVSFSPFNAFLVVPIFSTVPIIILLQLKKYKENAAANIG